MPVLEQILHDRLHRVTPAQQARLIAISAGLHILLSAGIWLSADILKKPKDKVEYVPLVRVVTPAALGIDTPRTPPPPPPPKKVEPPPPPPQVAPPPPPPKAPETPVIPVDKKPEPKPEPEPPPPAPPPPKPPPPAPAPPPPPAAQPPSPATPPQNPLARRGSPRGNPFGASSSAHVGVEDPNFTYGYYLDNMVALIGENWVRPPVGGRIDEAVVYYRIQRDGKVTDLRIAQSSGSEVFDRAALRAVEASSPLPPLPRGYKRDFLGINLVVQ